MRLPLSTLEVFAAIAEQGSFKSAADALGLKPSTVSHQLKTLEERLGVPLFIRTTRSVSLTEAGRALMRGANPAFEQLASAIDNARTTGNAAVGKLKLTLPSFVYDLVLKSKIASFCQQYPQIELELSMTDALSDILGQGMHAGFRMGDRISQDMIAIRLTPPMPLAVMGSPAYLAKNGTPMHPQDLLKHQCICYRYLSSEQLASWDFIDESGQYAIDVSHQIIVNTLPSWVNLAKQDVGLIYTLKEYCTQELETGELISVLEGHLPTLPGIFIYFPREYRSMQPLRLFIEHLQA